LIKIADEYSFEGVVDAVSGVFVDNIVVWDCTTAGAPQYLSWLHYKSRRGSPEGYFIPDPLDKFIDATTAKAGNYAR
jgi:hypothetical protein